MCNGRGQQIIFGMCDEWVRESAKYGYSTMNKEWADRTPDGKPSAPTNSRLAERYSPYIFALQLTEMVKNAGVDLLFDCIASEPVMDGNTCRGVVTESKSGREYYEADFVLDATGDCDILRRAGVPCVNGTNYYTYMGKQITLESCKTAAEKQNIYHAFRSVSGGSINLYGDKQPADKPLWSGTTVEEVTDYLVTNQLDMLNKLKQDDRRSREVAMLPMMPQFRTTCRIDGDYTFKYEDKYTHFDDSVCAINDFDHADLLYEIPYRCLIRKDFPNLITAGRSISAAGYGWDVVRVIPPAILTGQAAAEAAFLAKSTGKPLACIDVKALQETLEKDDNILIHFKDEWVPDDKESFVYNPASGGHN